MWGIWGSFLHSNTSALVNSVINLQVPFKVVTSSSAEWLLEFHSENSCSCYLEGLFLAVCRMHIWQLDICQLQHACACFWSTTPVLSHSSPDLQWIMLGLGLIKLSTFKKTHGSEHELKPKQKCSEHTLSLKRDLSWNLNSHWLGTILFPHLT